MAHTDRHPVEALAEDFVVRHRRGEKPSLTEYVKRFPEWSDEIRDLLPAALMMESLKRNRPGGASTAIPKQLGDYRLVREVGRGGMGIVYEAEQESLGRHVALKVLPARGCADAVKRFRREVKAAARLHHSNIVSVYGVSEADGTLFYVMPFIRGLPLDDLAAGLLDRSSSGNPRTSRHTATPLPASNRRIKGAPANGTSTSSASQRRDPALDVIQGPRIGPAYYRAVARIGVQVADALEYAHSQGVLHRDIKPANLILDAHGTVWITDFGLAHLSGQDRLTKTGDAPGTVRYMAPERFQGRSDARGDVYGLGVTLYELLALRPAFDAGDPATLLRQVTQGNPPTPRAGNAAVPADLETIVCKAIAREPERRYQSAADLSAELQRYLAGRPPLVRRASLLQRGWRSCRRNPTVAMLTAALAAVMLTAFLGITWKWRDAAAQRRRAQANLAVALDALEAISSRIGGEGLADLEGFAQLENGPPVSESSAALLREALAFYERFASENQDDVRIRRATAAAHARGGDIQRRLGRFEEAASAYQKAHDLYDRLGSTRDSAAASLRMGGALALAGKNADAEREFRRGVEDLDRQALLRPDDDEAQFEHAQARYLLAGLLWRSGQVHQGEQELRAAAEQLRGLTAGSRAKPAYYLTLARCVQRLAQVVRLDGRADEFARTIGEALDVLEKLVHDNPGTPLSRLELSQCLGTIGVEYQQNGQRDRAGPYLERSTDLARSLVADFPDPPHYQAHLARALRRLAMYHLAFGRRQPAEKAFKEALSRLDVVVAHNPDTPALRLQHAEAHLFAANLLREHGENTRALPLLQRAAASQEMYLRIGPASPQAREVMASIYLALGQTQSQLGHPLAAAEAQHKAEALRQPEQ